MGRLFLHRFRSNLLLSVVEGEHFPTLIESEISIDEAEKIILLVRFTGGNECRQYPWIVVSEIQIIPLRPLHDEEFPEVLPHLP